MIDSYRIVRPFGDITNVEDDQHGTLAYIHASTFLMGTLPMATFCRFSEEGG